MCSSKYLCFVSLCAITQEQNNVVFVSDNPPVNLQNQWERLPQMCCTDFIYRTSLAAFIQYISYNCIYYVDIVTTKVGPLRL